MDPPSNRRDWGKGKRVERKELHEIWAHGKGDGSKKTLYTLKSGSGFALSQMLTVPACKTFREMHNYANKANCKPVLVISQWRDYPVILCEPPILQAQRENSLF